MFDSKEEGSCYQVYRNGASNFGNSQFSEEDSLAPRPGPHLEVQRTLGDP